MINKTEARSGPAPKTDIFFVKLKPQLWLVSLLAGVKAPV